VTDLVELCAGTAAVSLAALGAPSFPASRRGSKRGWTGPILDALRVTAPVDHVVLVEIELQLARLLAALFSRDVLALADEIDARAETPARDEWVRAREGATPADTLLTIAASRGGTRDGGFKGGHCLRANVDGFTPNRHALGERVRAFAPFVGRATVLCVNATLVNPEAHKPTSVYLDPPYAGRRGYEETLADPVGVAKRWAAHGHHVVVSEAIPLNGATTTREITAMRRGQARNSNTNDRTEWISVFGGVGC
jgi:hypothetical protein